MTLHEARHTFASLMIAAGVNAKALATFMGHHSINITLDLTGILMPVLPAKMRRMSSGTVPRFHPAPLLTPL